MKSIYIEQGRLIDPGRGVDKVADLLIRGPHIDNSQEPPRAGKGIRIKAQGMVVCPGFIDLHCHLREPGYEDKETIESGTRAAARGGFTTVCCMPNTNPPIDNSTVVGFIKAQASSHGAIRVLPIGCITRGRQGKELSEMGRLAAAGVVGFSDDGNPVSDAQVLYQAFLYSRTFQLPLIEHCEDKDLAQDGQVNEGIIATTLGLKGVPAAAEEICIARDLYLARLTGARLHIAHVSTAGGVDLIRRAKAEGILVTAEVTPHHLTLTEDAALGYNTLAKVNPPLRTSGDIEALVAGLNQDVIDAIATDHAPHTELEKQCEFALAPCGISGLETALGSLMGLVHAHKISLNKLIEKMTWGPSRIIGDRFGKLGTLSPGSPADVTIFSPEVIWQVRPEEFLSRGRNTPLIGATLKGKVMATIFQGQLVYQDPELPWEIEEAQ
jgi:dihydroorotase